MECFFSKKFNLLNIYLLLIKGYVTSFRAFRLKKSTAFDQ